MKVIEVSLPIEDWEGSLPFFEETAVRWHNDSDGCYSCHGAGMMMVVNAIRGCVGENLTIKASSDTWYDVMLELKCNTDGRESVAKVVNAIEKAVKESGEEWK